MNTHDIELPPLPPLHIAPSVEPVDYPKVAQALMDYARAAIEADRKRRGEPVAWKWRRTPATKWECVGHWDSIEAKAAAEMENQGWEVVRLYDSPQPAEPIVSDVEAIVRLLESREWAEHVATTPLGQRLETAITVLVGADPQPAGPVKSHLKVSYDDKGDCLYVVCDSNEPADAEEDDKGILYRRAISDGRLVGITIMNFMGQYAKWSDDVQRPAEPVKVPSDAEIFELSHDFSGMTFEDLDVVGFARALLARYGNPSKSTPEIDTSAKRVDATQPKTDQSDGPHPFTSDSGRGQAPTDWQDLTK